MADHPVLNGLDQQQRAAAEHLDGPVRIVAGAGTGKTRTVTHRIAFMVLSGHTASSKILPLTHSQKAAGEMRHRLGLLGVGDVVARTFHAAALRQLKFFWGHLGRDEPLSILENRYQMVRRTLESGSKTDVSNDDVFDVASEISWAKSKLLTPETYSSAAQASKRDLALPSDEIASLFKKYEVLKRRAGKLDFEDLLGTLASLIESDPEVADHVRSTYTTFTIDEYQDVDPLQLKLLDAWLGSREEICIVGDPRQAIYAFKGASSDAFEDFRTRYPNAFDLTLFKDYRSTPQVVTSANKLIGSKETELIGQLPPGPAPLAQAFERESDEEAFIVSEIKSLTLSGVDLSEIAVLYRFNSQSARFETALSKAGIPYVVADSEKFFERPEVKAVLSKLWQAGKRQPEAVGLELLGEVLNSMGFDRMNPPAGAGAARARFEAVNALLSLVEEMPGIETLGVKYLIMELQHRSQEAHQPVQKGVTLSTLHKSKGLEWEVVFMVNMTEGSIPSSYASTPTLVAEEKRLAYVGVTRAKRVLHLSYAKANAKGWKSKPSRFLRTFGVETKTVKHRSRPTKNPTKPSFSECIDCKSPLGGGLRWVGKCSACMDQALAQAGEKLISWRRQAAREINIGPFEFLPDDLLWRLARAEPQKLSEVVTVEGFNDSPACGYGRDIMKLFKK